MKLKRKFEREVECHNCGAFLVYFEKDINVGKDTIKCYKVFYVICANCKQKIPISEYNIPKLIYDKLSKEYNQELNRITSNKEEITQEIDENEKHSK